MGCFLTVSRPPSFPGTGRGRLALELGSRGPEGGSREHVGSVGLGVWTIHWSSRVPSRQGAWGHGGLGQPRQVLAEAVLRRRPGRPDGWQEDCPALGPPPEGQNGFHQAPGLELRPKETTLSPGSRRGCQRWRERRGTGSFQETWNPQALAAETQGSWQHLVTSIFRTTRFSTGLAPTRPSTCISGPETRGSPWQAPEAGVRVWGGSSRVSISWSQVWAGPDGGCCFVSVLVFWVSMFLVSVWAAWFPRTVLTRCIGSAAHTRPASLAML